MQVPWGLYFISFVLCYILMQILLSHKIEGATLKKSTYPIIKVIFYQSTDMNFLKHLQSCNFGDNLGTKPKEIRLQ